MKKNHKILIIIIVLVLIIGAYFLYPVVEKQIRCPDSWGENRSFGGASGNEIFIKNGKNMALTGEEKKWIKENCNLKPVYSY